MKQFLRNDWKKYVENEPGYEETVEWDVFDSWERSTMPESRLERNVVSAMTNYCGGDPYRVADRFMERAVLVCDRVFAEERWSHPLCEPGFPVNRAECWQLKAYIRVWQESRLDTNMLLAASRDYEEWVNKCGSKLWGRDSIQFDYLTAVFLAILGGDLERARGLFKTKKKIRYHLEYRELLGLFANNESALPWPTTGPEYTAFEVYFDPRRSPYYKSKEACGLDIHRLELGILGEKYFGPGGSEIRWENVIARIAE